MKSTTLQPEIPLTLKREESGEGFLKINHLSLYYREKLALRDVSLSIAKGSLTALIGPSGCGKTSFLSSINRLTDLIPGCRVEGEILIHGTPIHGPQVNVTQLRRKVGMIFQKPNPFPLSIWRNLELPIVECCPMPKSELAHRIESVLRSVNLWEEVKDRLHSSALALSGGQQQRLCLARALALNPEVLLMDEPCSALDPLSSGAVEDLILSLKNRYTVVVVTHNLSQARRISDQLVLFWVQEGSGCLIESGPTQQLFDNPQEELTAAYINGIRG